MTACVVCQERERDLENNLLTCSRCAGRLAGALRQIPKLVDELRVELVPDEDARDPVAVLLPAGPQKGSWRESRIRSTRPERLPIAVDPTDLLMPARAGSVGVRTRGRWSAVQGGDPDQVGHLSAATVLDSWVRDWAETRGEGLPALRTRERSQPVGVLSGWLADRLDWALRHHLALDEFARDVGDLAGALFGLARGGRVRPKPMEADCPRCRLATLIQQTPEDHVECVNPDCLRVLTPAEYADHVRSLIEESAYPDLGQ